MRILTWNINGIRTLPQYHPWNTFKSFNEILDHLQSDIICLQETKTSRSALPKSVAVPDSYHAFFSFPIRKTGYSGVAVYTRAVPIKAEEGLSGLIQPKPPLSEAELVSDRDIYPPPSLNEGLDLDLLDSEGRALTIDFGLFVLINVYCPNDGVGTDERDKFKMDFHRLLEARVKGLVEKEGREVMVLGDINACAAVIDHCEGSIIVTRGQANGKDGEEGFWEKDCRRWIRDWLVQDGTDRGCLVDIVRRFWPERKGMYTCWNTKIFARESNYGTRIDYILITKGLVPWVKAADVQQDIKGSDHCPVFVDLHDEITSSDGSIIRLRDVFGARLGAAPPRLSAQFWDEFSGKQTQLHKYFVKKAPLQTANSELANSSEDRNESLSSNKSPSQDTIISQTQTSVSSSSTPIHLDSSPPTTVIAPSIATETRAQKRKLFLATPLELTKRQKGKHKPEGGQMKLSSFYGKSKTIAHNDCAGNEEAPPSPVVPQIQVSATPIDVDDFSEEMFGVNGRPSDTEIEEFRSSQGSTSSFHSASPGDIGEHNGNGKGAWSTILAPTPIPRCNVHNELAKEFTVKKQGPNKGKRFFICSRPVGPGYDKGPAERLREEVDPQYRCNFFKWASDARRDMKRLTGELTDDKC